ncbi:hypothetical protein BpHYR1_008866 [Brachionus plicatilis]|uniref:Uncharacterized protein n=1 Tax=Brachionus plicatilis TaxID=10195 RepID=A0A3M7Q0S7_BRAPC|nr:hypothetical protein BpHYR1_008866 [Brachionus plicatilis]
MSPSHADWDKQFLPPLHGPSEQDLFSTSPSRRINSNDDFMTRNSIFSDMSWHSAKTGGGCIDHSCFGHISMKESKINKKRNESTKLELPTSIPIRELISSIGCFSPPNSSNFLR